MFLTIFFKPQNIVQTMHLTMLIAHPYPSCKDRCDNFEEMGNKLEQMCKIYQLKCSVHELFTKFVCKILEKICCRGGAVFSVKVKK